MNFSEQNRFAVEEVSFCHVGFLNLSFHQKLSKNGKVHKIGNLSLKKLIQGPYF